MGINCYSGFQRLIEQNKSWGKTFKCHSFDLELPQVIKIKKTHKNLKSMIVLQVISIV